MRKFFSISFVFVIALMLLLASQIVKNYPDTIANVVGKLSEGCTAEKLRCTIFASLYKDILNMTYGVKRQVIPKNKLPIVRIYISDGAIAKLNAKRASVLAKHRAIMITERNDWVKGSVIVEYSDRKEKSKVRLRLKGDWGDHLARPKKLSFRIKTRAGGYLFGLKTFSIQHPATRRYGNEPLLLSSMRKHNILAPRYKFVDVYLNEYPIGIMAMEEHFRKEMIEAQNRRTGPILAINENPLWDQWNINYNAPNPNGSFGFNFSGHRDTTIKNFTGSKFLRGSIPTNNVLRGQALLRDFLDGKISARETFDFEKLSRYWILTNIWGGCHSSVWHNRRYYFNPISGVLEPVSFDNLPHPEKFKFCADVDIKVALKDTQFLTQVTAASKEIRTELQSDSFENWLKHQQDRYSSFFALEKFRWKPKPITHSVLAENLEIFLKELNMKYVSNAKPKKSYRKVNNRIVQRKFLQTQPNLAMHLTAFYYPSKGSGNLEFRNLTLKDIKLLKVYFERKNGAKIPVEFSPLKLDSAEVNSKAVLQRVQISEGILSQKGGFILEYSYNGRRYKRSLDVQFKNYNSGFQTDPIATIRDFQGNKTVDTKNRQIIFAAGPHIFTQSVSLPKGWRIILEAGAVLSFKDGALLKLQGPLFAQGTADAPIIVNIETNTKYNEMGSWGGILVSKSPLKSRINHLKLQGTGTQNLKNRQGYYGMTGCLSFYESNVNISNSSFIDAQCEDALNIVKSDFVLDGISIVRARADAFDSDFSTGLIKNSSIIASGNDGIDISGTRLVVDGVQLLRIGDKAISVGEKSTLHAVNVKIDGALLGIVSKDLSTAHAKSITFANITGTALMTYIKKQEYGPSSIDCTDCSFAENTVIAGRQDRHKITVNGAAVERNKLTIRQILDAGLIKKAAF